MKVVFGIILTVVLLAALVLYILLMLNSHDLTYCGDAIGQDGNKCTVTRVYTADLNADETLSEIVNTMNNAESGNISAQDLTEILTTYQNVIYAPVFTYELTKEDDRTFVLTGSVYNGLDKDGNPIQSDFYYTDLTLTAGLPKGKVLAAQNIYSGDVGEDGEPAFTERNGIVDPVLIDEGAGAAFAFRDCDSFRIVFTGIDEAPASITLAYTYNVVAENPLNFTHIEGGAMGITITEAYDDSGRLTPVVESERVYEILTDTDKES